MFLIYSCTHSLAHTFPLPLHHSLLPVDFSSEPIWYGFCLLVYFPPFPVCSKLCFFMWFTSPFQLCCSQFFQVMVSAFVFRNHCTCCRDLSLRINLDSPIPPHTTTLSDIQPLYLLGPCG